MGFERERDRKNSEDKAMYITVHPAVAVLRELSFCFART